MKTYGAVEVRLQAFLTLALDGNEWLASRTGRFTSGEISPATHRTGGYSQTPSVSVLSSL